MKIIHYLDTRSDEKVNLNFDSDKIFKIKDKTIIEGKPLFHLLIVQSNIMKIFCLIHHKKI